MADISSFFTGPWHIMMLFGVIAMVAGGIWLIIEAFKTSLWWGLANIFVPFAGLLFAILYWHRAGGPFLLNLGGAIIMLIGAHMAAQSGF